MFGNFPAVLFWVFVLGCVVGRGVFVLLTHCLVEHCTLLLLDALGRVLGHTLLVENLHALSESIRTGSLSTIPVCLTSLNFPALNPTKTNLSQEVVDFGSRLKRSK